MQNVRLQFASETFPVVACELLPPVALPRSFQSPDAPVGSRSCASASAAAKAIEDMSEEEQMILAIALSSAPEDVSSVDSAVLSSAECVSSPNLKCADAGASAAAADVGPVSDSSAAPGESKNDEGQESGTCGVLKFLIPFDACSALPAACARVSLVSGNAQAPLGDMRFEAGACSAECSSRARLKECSSSITLESLRMLDEQGELSDECVEAASCPALVGGRSFIDLAMVENAIKKILSEELLVCRAQ
jgi:hypothetical protein